MHHKHEKQIKAIIIGFILAAVILFAVFIMRTAFLKNGSNPEIADDDVAREFSVTGLSINGDTSLWITDDPAPRFSWQMESRERGKYQTAYQIRVWENENIIWDTGKTMSADSAFIKYNGEKLQPESAYEWQVAVWDEKDNCEVSDRSSFETALMQQGFGGAKWIHAPAAGRTDKQELSSAEGDYDLVREDVFTIEADFIIKDYSAGFVWGYEGADFGMYLETVEIDPQAGTSAVSLKHLRKYIQESKSTVDITEYLTAQDLQNVPVHITIEVKGTHVSTILNGIRVAEIEIPKPRSINDDFGFQPLRGSVFLVDNYEVRDADGNIRWEENFSDPYNTIFGNQCVDVTDLMWEGEDRGGWMKSSASLLLTPGDYYTGKSAPIFGKHFSTSGKGIERARLYVTADGIYDCKIDGRNVTDTLLNPGNAPYNLRTVYQAYDVTDLFTDTSERVIQTNNKDINEHQISVTLGHGWYDRAVGYDGVGAVWGESTGILARLDIFYVDGSRQTIETDGSWEVCTDGPVLLDDLWQGEVYDASRNRFQNAQYADEFIPSWFDGDNGIIILQEEPPVRIIETLAPIRETKTERGTIVYDFGQEITGVCEVTLQGPAGACITMRHGEWLNNEKMLNCDGPAGSVYMGSLLGAQSMDRYFIGQNNTVEVFMPAFTFHGFRYMELLASDDNIEIITVKAKVFASDMKETGSFSCSDELLNRIYENAKWSIRGNTVSIPTDCPQRTERYGWTGDAQIISPTIMYMLNAYSFYRDYERDILDIQNESGEAPDMAPRNFDTDLAGRSGHGGHNGWGDAIVLIPWNLYETYGDRRVLEEAYDGMAAWIGYLVNNSEDWIRPDSGYGDHLAADDYAYSCINTAWSAHVCHVMSKIAAILGKSEESVKFGEFYNQYRVAWVNSWMLEDGTVTAGSEGAYILGLAFELVPDHLRMVCAEKLAEKLKEDNCHLSTGFAGISYVLPLLSDAGYSDIAYRILSEETYPSLGFQIGQGSTTNWEHWRVLQPIADIKMPEEDQESDFENYPADGYILNGSLNHCAFGSAALWLPQYLAGIRPDPEHVGYRHFSLQPDWKLLPYVPDVQAVYESVYGKILSHVTLDEESGRIEYRCSIPANTSAQLTIPYRGGAADHHDMSLGNSITESGKLLQDADGITILNEEDTGITLELASGEYSFSF